MTTLSWSTTSQTVTAVAIKIIYCTMIQIGFSLLKIHLSVQICNQHEVITMTKFWLTAPNLLQWPVEELKLKKRIIFRGVKLKTFPILVPLNKISSNQLLQLRYRRHRACFIQSQSGTLFPKQQGIISLSWLTDWKKWHNCLFLHLRGFYNWVLLACHTYA